MATQAFLLLTSAENDTVAAISATNPSPGYFVEPREIDNPMADQLGYGTLLGAFALPARLLNDSQCDPWRSTLENHDIRILDSEVIFVPVV